MGSYDITGFDDFIAFAEQYGKEQNLSNMPATSSPDTAVEQTIQIMQEVGTCLHPVHLHSFQQVHFILSFNSVCAACNERISFLSSDPVVKCIACGVLSHRSCAVDTQWERSKWCPVNAQSLSRRNSSASSEGMQGDLKQANDELVEEKEDNTPKGRWNDEDENSTDDLEEIAVSGAEETPKSAADATAASIQTWTKEGPPQHWALGQRTKQAAAQENETNDVEENNSANETPVGEKGPLHHSNQSFPSVARALQENVLASFNRGKQQGNSSSSSTTPQRRTTAPYPGARAQLGESNRKPDTSIQREEENQNTIAKFADRTFEAVKGKVTVSAVAGGIAGGIAGLALAGPAGAYAGYVAAGAAGSLMVEGAATLGVVVAGIATGGLTGQQIQGHIEERRILTMGEEGASSKVLLVRPNIKIDPIWYQICREAKRSAPVCLRKLQRCDSDIVKTAEDEIETSDKVLLLVSRILNDKTSLPGHVYRYLVEAFMDRARMRKSLCETNSSISSTSPRARRDDAHAVIKHVTATLMEERPEFGSSPRLTEVTATAVEGLVFGQLYDSVFEEIVEATFERDVDLWRKITLFGEGRRGMNDDPLKDLVSEQALGALKMLPQARSAADKLHFCVRFLDLISEHFSNSTASNICADSLLKMVCQHLILIENQGSCNAQLAFLEEFARDEQLLRGREGYALVTLQASLHFLNMSTDFQRDIFQDEEAEEEEGAQKDERRESTFLIVGESESSAEPCSL